ncbi:MAG: PAAR domain-containing protein [Bryobacterales bacterium]|nr:PAAR domain-containing protein [Bryobacterales bacterium]MCZ2148794.1 PAAR domain-containing protein [Bryobacterales bacterium]
MPQGPAARITDPVVHPLPPVLTPGPGSANTIIGYLLAWRGLPAAAAAGLQAAKQAADIAVQTAEAATAAAAGTPGAPAAYAAEQTLKTSTLAAMSSMITSMAAGGVDIHMCTTPSPVPPHGPGVVIDGSPTVLINNMPACRMGDTIIEPLGPPNKIAMGCATVIIGQSGMGCPTNVTPGTPLSVRAQLMSAPPGTGTGGAGKEVPEGTASPSSHTDQTGSGETVGVGGQYGDVGDGGGSVWAPGPTSATAAAALMKAAENASPVIQCGKACQALKSASTD